MQNTAVTQGVHHVGFTVPDIRATQRFFTEVLGYRVVGEKPEYPAVFVSDGTTMLTLWQAERPEEALPFDRRHHVGLHHIALKVPTQARLDALHARLQTAEDVQLEFAPQPLGEGGWRHLMCFIPGGLRVEFTCDAVES